MAYRTQKSAADDLIALRKKLRDGEMAPVYLFHLKSGERDKDTVEFLISKLTGIVLGRFRTDPGAKFNIDVFDASEAKLSHALAVARTAPMFGARRLAVFRGSAAPRDEDADRIISYMKSPPVTATLVLCFLTARLPDRLLKEAGKLGFAHKIESLNERSLTKWISCVFREEDIKISADAVSTIAQYAGCDLQVIEDAKDKLVLYAAGKERIEAADVEELLLASRSAEIYELADALWERNPPKAMMVLKRLENQKTDTLFINTILAQQIRSLIKIKSITTRERMRSSDLASLLGLKEFIVKKHMSRARKFTLRELETALSVCAEMNVRLKSSRMNGYRIIENAAFKILSLQV